MCLTLGFRGRYEVIENGMYQLEELRGEVWRVVRKQRADALRPLSPKPAVVQRRTALVRYVPLWVVCCIAAFVALAVFGGLRYALQQDIDGTTVALDRAAPPR